MLQKIVNGIAIASGVVSLTVIGLGGYVFIRKDAIIENVKGKIMEAVIPGGLGESIIPEMGNPIASPDAPTEQAEPTAPVLPLGF